MKKRFLILILVVAMVMPPPLFENILAIINISSYSAFALPFDTGESEFKIGDITKFSGDVLVRTKGKWHKLMKVPYPIYNSDKVVTKQGRAEVGFSDRGVLRFDIDTNISISQNMEKKGFIFKKEIITRQIKVLVGNVWFDVKMKEKESTSKFRTPSMAAIIRDASGKINVEADGSTHYGLDSGKGDATGIYHSIDNPKLLRLFNIKILPKSLPLSDPLVIQLPIQKAATNAFMAHQEALQLLSDSKEKFEKTATDRPIEQTKAATDLIGAYLAATEADIAGIELAIEDIKRLGTTKSEKLSSYQERKNSLILEQLAGFFSEWVGTAIAADNESDRESDLKKAEKALKKAKNNQKNGLKAYEKALKNLKTAQENKNNKAIAKAIAAATVAAKDVAIANAQAAQAYKDFVLLDNVSDEKRKVVEKVAQEADKYADKAEEAAEKASEQIKNVKNASNSEATEAFVATAKAYSAAAAACANVSGANAYVALACYTSTDNSDSVEALASAAGISADEALSLADTTSKLAQNVLTTSKKDGATNEIATSINVTAAKANAAAAVAKASAAVGYACAAQAYSESGDSWKAAELEQKAEEAAENARKAGDQAGITTEKAEKAFSLSSSDNPETADSYSDLKEEAEEAATEVEKETNDALILAEESKFEADGIDSETEISNDQNEIEDNQEPSAIEIIIPISDTEPASPI